MPFSRTPDYLTDRFSDTLKTVLLQENIPLAPLTTLGVGGPARYFAEARTAAEVRSAVREALQRRLPLFILGGGSNLVVSDDGFPGLVLKVAIGGIEKHQENGRAIFDAGAGVEWDTLVARAVDQNCAGIECLSGIPGTVGGTPVQNVGAYGQEVSETISEVQTLDVQTGEIVELCPEACQFAYRTSVFNTLARGRYIILRVSYALAPEGEAAIRYADLRHVFAKQKITSPTLQQVRDAVREIRRSKAMLIVPDDEDCHSAGSFFKNPIVTASEHRRLDDLASQRGFELPSFETGEGMKVPAAWLIEHSGFHKGDTRGMVGISRRHTLAIVNRGQARAADVIALKDEIQAAVREQWNVELRPEPVFIGFE
ncbi:MAG TPA: UDP-N-acetylmuramate dehydrogenase [Terriglobales bacterium]|nr:UDP-N-acetylmuramate dehydrogenase [Terriglobales bacterium]